MDIQPKIRLELANRMYENGLGDKSAHTPAFAELSANFERMKNKVEEERRFQCRAFGSGCKTGKTGRRTLQKVGSGG